MKYYDIKHPQQYILAVEHASGITFICYEGGTVFFDWEELFDTYQGNPLECTFDCREVTEEEFTKLFEEIFERY